jgi:hypothetical protein
MATYKVTIEVKTNVDEDEDDLTCDILNYLDSFPCDYLELSSVEKMSIEPEEALEEIKDLISLKLNDGSVLIEDLFEIINKVN